MRAAAALVALVLSLPAGAASLVERLPAAAQVIGQLDVARLRASGLVDAATLGRAAVPGDEAGVLAWVRRAGVDPGKDIDVLAFGLLPVADTGNRNDFAVLANGRFDRAALEKHALSEGGQRQMVANGSAAPVPAIRLPGQARDPLSALLSFLPDGTLVLASEKGTALVQGTSKASDLFATARGLVPGQAAAWVAAGGRGVTAAGGPMAASLKELVLWAQPMAQALELRGVGRAASDQSAAQLAGILQLGAALGQAQYPALANAKLTADGSRVSLTLPLTAAQLAALLKPRPVTPAPAAPVTPAAR